MLNVTDLAKLKKLCKKMKSIIRPEVEPLVNGDKQLFIAPIEICTWAQNLISQISAHRCLKEAKILILIKVAPGDTKKLLKGERIEAGTAAIPSPTGKLLSQSRIGKAAGPVDFVIILSGDWLRALGVFDSEFKMIESSIAKESKAMALIDHELSHCSPKIAGQFIDPDQQEEFIKQLGGRHIETLRDVLAPDDSGGQLVKYYAIKDNKFIWSIRKHDIEEFTGTASRFGAWDPQLGQFVDELKKNVPSLFDKGAA